MVICDKYNFIFLRIPKNASTSLATFFVKNCCDSNDIYTEIGDSKIKTNNISQDVVDKHRKQYRFIHLTLNEIIQEKLISEDKAKTKQVLGVIRNPFQRQLSLYFFKNRNTKNKISPIHFRDQFARGYHEDDGSNHILQTDYTKIGDKQYGTFWRYEDINARLDEFTRMNEILVKEPLQTYKSNIKPKDENLLYDFYDDRTRKIVEDYFKEDFEAYEQNR